MFVRDAITINGQSLTELKLVAENFYEWQPIEISCKPLPDVVFAELHIAEAQLGAPATTLGDPTWRWRWQPQHAVGRFTARLTLRYANGLTHVETFDLRIVPRKLDWDQYEALLAAIQHDAYGLIYALSGGRVGAQLTPEQRQRSLIEEYWTLVEGLADKAIAITKQIAARPHTTLQPQPARASLSEIERVESGHLHEITREPLDDVADDVLPALQQALRPPDRLRGGPLPRTLPTQRRSASHALVEHRVLKYVLHALHWRVGFVRDMLRREQQRRQRNAALSDVLAPLEAVQQWQARCNQVLRSLRHCLALPFLADMNVQQAIAGPTHLMRHDQRYRRLWALYRSLRTTPFVAFNSPALWLSIQELPLLYEQWCMLQVIKAALPLGEVIAQELLVRDEVTDTRESGVSTEQWTLRLKQDGPLLTMLLPHGARLAIYYQRRYRPVAVSSSTLGALDPFVRIPDIALELAQPEAPPRVLIFDAKYRVAPDGRVPQDALDDAYTYRGAIGAAGQRATLGAFLLFPGSTPLTTADHVGALPLLPNRVAELHEIVQQFLNENGQR